MSMEVDEFRHAADTIAALGRPVKKEEVPENGGPRESLLFQGRNVPF
jgi:hypothetical protein